ncbi:YciI family protein [Herbidospora cretacea]|uniref:YciI family protein n=1 Tax=Herbidospora cretacea TaxID=28444 RepID=UPI0007741603|nr:YciI family protein [Herbidospora cretacea]
MRYLLLSLADENTPAPDERLFAEMGAFIEEMSAKGILLATGGLEPGGLRMTSAGGETTVTDGPFTEAKEAAVGFALVEVTSEEEVLELTRRFRRVVGDGVSEIRRVL